MINISESEKINHVKFVLILKLKFFLFNGSQKIGPKRPKFGLTKVNKKINDKSKSW